MEAVSVLAKALASDKLKIRKRAQLDVSILLRKQQDKSNIPSYTEMLAICKGLHYSLWMQDKLLLKEEVVHRICSTLPLIPNPVVRHYYFNGIFETLAREWDKLDNWRVDKFMLLARDFFVQGLKSFPAVDSKLWNSFLDSVFEKILNTDVQHAVGLKLHMCNVLCEELSRKKVKNRCIVSTLTRLVCCLAKLPRHHSYPHSILHSIYRLLGILRKRSKPMVGNLLTTLDSFATQQVAHRKSLKRITAVVRTIADRKTVETDSTANQFVGSDDGAYIDESSAPSSFISEVTIESQSAAPPSQSVSKKRKKSDKLTGPKDKRRRLSKSTELAAYDPYSNSSGTTPVISPALSILIPTHRSQPSLTTLQSEELIEGKSTAESQQPAEAVSDEMTAIPIGSLADSPDLPNNVINACKRRVSFGKIFRKSAYCFSTMKVCRLYFIPTITLNPHLKSDSNKGYSSRSQPGPNSISRVSLMNPASIQMLHYVFENRYP